MYLLYVFVYMYVINKKSMNLWFLPWDEVQFLDHCLFLLNVNEANNKVNNKLHMKQPGKGYQYHIWQLAMSIT